MSIILEQPAPRDFEGDLAESENTRHQKFWNKHYSLRFPTIQDRSYGTTGQREGRDCYVYLTPDRHVIKVDEKIRPDKDYGDIALEYQHCYLDGTVRHGWVEKLARGQLDIDYIAYGIKPADKVHWLEAQSLARAWTATGELWKETYFNPHSSTTRGEVYWETDNVAVPAEVLLEAGVKIITT